MRNENLSKNANKAYTVIRTTKYGMLIKSAATQRVYVGSYKTLVAWKDLTDGKLHRSWGDWSRSTMNHIRKALGAAPCKAEWESMEVDSIYQHMGKTTEDSEYRAIASYIDTHGKESDRKLLPVWYW